MAIIIPSKNIYNKDFDPIADNSISRIEITAKEIKQAYDYETPIYNPVIPFGTGDISHERMLGVPFYRAVAIRKNGVQYIASLSIENIIYDTFFSFNIAIPKKYIDKLITKVYSGKRDGGEAFIGISKSWDREKIYYNEIPNVFYPNAENPYNYFLYNKIQTFNYTNIIEENEIRDSANRTIIFNVAEENDDVGFIKNWSIPQIGTNENNNIEADATFNLKYEVGVKGNLVTNFPILESDLSEIKYKEENEEFIFYDIKILFERDMYSSSSALILHSKETNIEEWEQTYPAKAVKCVQKVNQVTLTFYGNTVRLDLSDKNISIGEGNDTHSFGGNELVQTTNVPKIENMYKNIIDKWKNGKQTATLTCPITDYYDENGNKIIDINVSGKMLFKEGDIVIPYIYTNDGDKPMSYNKDFTPKQFKIVGTSISKRQGCMQELTLLEL